MAVIGFLHHRYRTLGGEEHAIARLRDLVETELGEQTVLLERSSSTIGSVAAARGLLGGGSDPRQVAAFVRGHGVRVVHAHNLHPTFGWRALEAAKQVGAGTVLHLHNYRLVCAVGTCVDPAGQDCTRCHGRNTTAGVVGRCRGNLPEAVVYGAGLARQQRRLTELADVVVVPSRAAHTRLKQLGAPLGEVEVLGHPVPLSVERSSAASGEYVLVTARLAPEKGVDLAISACVEAGLPLVIAGSGPLREQLQWQAQGHDVRFVEPGSEDSLAGLRAGARIQLVPSRAAETFGLAALEAMAAGLPVVAARVGALADLDGVSLVASGDVAAMAAALRDVWERAREQGAHALEVAREVGDPGPIAARLAAIYERAAA